MPKNAIFKQETHKESVSKNRAWIFKKFEGSLGGAWGSMLRGLLGEAWGRLGGPGKPGETWGGLEWFGKAWGSLGELGQH